MKLIFGRLFFCGVFFLTSVACSSPARDISSTTPTPPSASPTPSASTETVQAGEIQIAMSSDCRIIFTNRDQRKAQWGFPMAGPCHFSKDISGKVKVFQQSGKKSEKTHLVIAHSTSPDEDGKCGGLNAGIVIQGGRILVASPPFASHETCIDPKGGFDEKHYTQTLKSLLKSKQYEEVRFPR